MALSHEILGISLDEINSASGKDEIIERAYEKKLAELQEEKEKEEMKIDAALFNQRKALLKQAYDDLLKKYKSSDLLISTEVNDTRATAVGKSAYLADILFEHARFVDDEYKDHPNKEQFKGKELSFSSFDKFKNSDYFKDMSAGDGKKFTQDNFPKKAIVLSFASWKDALAFHEKMEREKKMSPGTTQKLMEGLLKKGWIDETGNDIRPPARQMRR